MVKKPGVTTDRQTARLTKEKDVIWS